MRVDLNARDQEAVMLRQEVEQLQSRLADSDAELQRVKEQGERSNRELVRVIKSFQSL